MGGGSSALNDRPVRTLLAAILIIVPAVLAPAVPAAAGTYCVGPYVADIWAGAEKQFYVGVANDLYPGCSPIQVSGTWSLSAEAAKLGTIDQGGVFRTFPSASGDGNILFSGTDFGVTFAANAAAVHVRVCPSSVGPGIPAPTTVRSGIPGFHADWYGQSGYPTLCAGQRSTAVVAYYNSGSLGWVADRAGQTAYLGTWGPEPGQDQPSPLGGDGTSGTPSTAWPSPNRIAKQPAAYVGPGQVAWFQFTILAPQTPGTYTLYLRPLVEGATWLEDVGVYWVVTVLGADGKPVVEHSLTMHQRQDDLVYNGAGQVTRDPKGRFDGARWWYPVGTVVTLTPVPATGNWFGNFFVSGDCLVAGCVGRTNDLTPAKITLDADKTVDYGFYVPAACAPNCGTNATPGSGSPTGPYCGREWISASVSTSSHGNSAIWVDGVFYGYNNVLIQPARTGSHTIYVEFGIGGTDTFNANLNPCYYIKYAK